MYCYLNPLTGSFTLTFSTNYSSTVSGPLTYKWIINFLSNRSQQVVLNNKQTISRNVVSGVPQGTVLALLLPFLLIYINDLPTSVVSKVGVYANDVILYSNISSVEDCNLLQKMTLTC